MNMSSKKGYGRGFYDANVNNNPSTKGCASGISGLDVNQVTHDMAEVKIVPTNEGDWEFCSKKSRNRPSISTAKELEVSQKTGGHPELTKLSGGTNGGMYRPSGNSWAQVRDPRKQSGRGTPKPQPSKRNWESAYMARPVQHTAITPPLQNGWQWAAKNDLSSSQQKPLVDADNKRKVHLEGETNVADDSETANQQPEDSDDDDEFVVGSDEDFSDEYASDVSPKSHETRKKSNWYTSFFEELDKLTVEQINEPTRQWHCPACKDGPGAIDWYKGLQPLLTHAKTKGSKRVKIHRELAELLEEELQRKGASIILAGEAFGKWKGLRETPDNEIVWPPMVIIMNTLLEKDENEKWIGMGNPELLEYFSDHNPQKARHSYGPCGHRGMSLLIFEATVVGFLEAEQLHKHLEEEGKGRDAWERRRVLFYHGGKRQLYGYLACKEDMDIFNQHSQGKSRLRFELRSYQEMVVIQMRQMSEDNQQLFRLKSEVARQALHKKTLEASFMRVSERLRESIAEKRIVMERTTRQYKENKEEMDYQEQFFKEEIAKLQKATAKKGQHHKNLPVEEPVKAKQTDVESVGQNELKFRKEEFARLIDCELKNVEDFEAAREVLVNAHEESKTEMKRRHLEEEVQLESEFSSLLSKLIEKYAPAPEASASS